MKDLTVEYKGEKQSYATFLKKVSQALEAASAQKDFKGQQAGEELFLRVSDELQETIEILKDGASESSLQMINDRRYSIGMAKFFVDANEPIIKDEEMSPLLGKMMAQLLLLTDQAKGPKQPSP